MFIYVDLTRLTRIRIGIQRKNIELSSRTGTIISYYNLTKRFSNAEVIFDLLIFVNNPDRNLKVADLEDVYAAVAIHFLML